MVRYWVCAIVAVAMSGCANFKAVSAFATETERLTATIDSEFKQLDTLCEKQATLSIVINDNNDQPLEDCKTLKAARGRFALVTVEVLGRYAKTLTALADNKSLDMSSDIDGLAKKVKNLKGPDGSGFVDDKQLDALNKVAQVLVDVVTAARREAAVRRLTAETANLKASSDILRRFFGGAATSPAIRAQSPYGNWIGLVTSTAQSNASSLGSPAFAGKEPLRTAELRREVKAVQTLLAQRQAAGEGSVPAKIVNAIGAWQTALLTFEKDALVADAPDMLLKLNDLRDKAAAARDAVEGLSK